MSDSAMQTQVSGQEVNHVVVLVESISGDRTKAVEWLSQPLDTFGGKTPLQLIAEGRTESLIGYLHSIASGYVG